MMLSDVWSLVSDCLSVCRVRREQRSLGRLKLAQR